MRGMPGNMQGMMKQMQKMQKEMGKAQEELHATEFTASAPDEMVKVVFTGDKKMKDMQINPEAIDPDDPDMLQDLVIAAVNDAMNQIDQATEKKLGKFTKGMPM
ncbi:YbaB/EbfC family nucleoid-associated protein [Lactobacillus sp. CC-MHH1034]|uniref:YbaB/EbfC family nucleoid-associated protein n=1 Tax=Agrilactobacillus fermenti TaxID=2586909 RepID=UPI001E307BCA|nr:YbaB/EbfC family nucleoid-associated protein [Agrilactobacillus fermenti]MCD2255442.1 YbaB/EbfC family nucleoid-associated protein [Agrilactobacillus fermenti]